MQILEKKINLNKNKILTVWPFFPPSPLKFRNEGWVKNIGAHLRQAGVKAPIYWENKESGRKYFQPVEGKYFCCLIREQELWKGS